MATSPAARKKSKIGQALDQLALDVERTLKHAGPDQVHNLRVATRRMGQTLAVVEDSGFGKIRRELKSAIKLAGPVRDCDIAQKLIAKVEAPATLSARLERRRRKA